MPMIAEKIGQINSIVQIKLQKIKEKKIKNKRAKLAGQPAPVDEEEVSEENPLEQYITCDSKINYEKVLSEEILEGDKILLDRMGRAAQFGGLKRNWLLHEIKTFL